MRPLVEPGPPLSPRDAERFSRHALLAPLGEAGQRRLRRSAVCVVGAGGLGSPALLYLAAAGIGRLGVVDRDAVELSNLQRQVLHGSGDVGRSKTASARDALAALDPGLDVVTHEVDLTAANAREVLAGYDVVLDGTDNFPTRYVVNDACADLGIPLVWGSVLGFDAQVSVFWSDPPGQVGVDLRDLFPEPPAPGEVPSCAQAGVLGALCGQVGALMATEAVKLVTGVGEPLLGRVLVLDALAARWAEVPLRRDPARAARPTRSGHARPGTQAVHDLTMDAGEVEVEAARLQVLIRGARPPAVVDVREAPELLGGTIPGAIHVPLAALQSGDGLAQVPPGRPVVLYCASGVRSALAARLLRAAGRTEVAHLAGGFAAWQRAGPRSAGAPPAERAALLAPPAGGARATPADATPTGGTPVQPARGRLAG